jgi:hypothetical protein
MDTPSFDHTFQKSMMENDDEEANWPRAAHKPRTIFTTSRQKPARNCA